MKILLSLVAAALMTASVQALAAEVNVEGVVQSISGDTITVKTGEGRTTIVDVSDAEDARVVLGEQVTVTGAFAPELNKFKARAIQVARLPS